MVMIIVLNTYCGFLFSRIPLIYLEAISRAKEVLIDYSSSFSKLTFTTSILLFSVFSMVKE